jgi:SAM-dependent methyltransferase
MVRSSKQRRALTTVRSTAAAPGRGDPALVAKLADSLQIGPDQDALARTLTHGIHAYPARMHPATARALLELVLEGTTGARPPVVLDPFCGSGTTLVEARRRGARARGVDANPLAVLIARAKTGVGRPAQRAALVAAAERIGGDVLAEGRAARRAGGGVRTRRAPRGVDADQRDRQLAHWFSAHVRRELEAIAAHIDAERAADPRRADALLAVLSSILYKVSRRESDTSARRVDRAIARGAPARLFMARARELAAGLDQLGQVDGPNVGVARGNARHLDRADIASGSVDAVVTSPPYPGTYDYLAHQSLRMAFLGLSSGSFRRSEIGARRDFRGGAEEQGRALSRWQRGFSQALGEMARVLRPGGKVAMVIGDSIAGDRAIYADQMVAELAPASLELVAIASQPRPLLGERERRGFARLPKREHAIVLQKR